MAFTPVAEMVPRNRTEKGVKDFFREGQVDNLGMTMQTVVLFGGAGGRGGGGGGGYSGGSSGNNEDDSCGGGGGSYNVGKDQQNDCCYNTAGHGKVIITLL